MNVARAWGAYLQRAAMPARMEEAMPSDHDSFSMMCVVGRTGDNLSYLSCIGSQNDKDRRYSGFGDGADGPLNKRFRRYT